METAVKYYPERYGSYGEKQINVIIRWTPQFLQSIKQEFGLEGEFTSLEVAQLFSSFFSINATRLKLWRMYRQGWFTRKCRKGIYYYNFSKGAKKYYHFWIGFDNEEGPLMVSSNTKFSSKPFEVRTEIIDRDRYLGEV